jgi:KDO2-lipid IV(A) lauroyltransferase
MGQEDRQKRGVFFRAADLSLLSFLKLTGLLSNVLPPSFLYASFRAAGLVLYHSRPGVKHRLEEKIAQALPGESGERIRGIAAQACSAALLPMLDLVVFRRFGDEFMRALRVEGRENLERAEEEGKGIVFVTAHLGLFSVLHAVMHRLDRTYTPIMYHPLETPLPRYVSAMALLGHSLGGDPEEPVFWAGKNTVEKVVRHLRQGKRVGLTFDVVGGTVVELFGRPAALASGIAHFIRLAGVPALPVALFREDQPLGGRLVFYPPVPPREKEGDVSEIMQEVAQRGETMIREAPGQWMSWFGLWEWWEQGERKLGRRETGSPAAPRDAR